VLGACSDFTGTVYGYSAGDVFDFAGIDFSDASLIYCAADGTLTVSDSLHHETIHLDGSYDASDFGLFDDGDGHAAVSTPPIAENDNVIVAASALDGGDVTIRSDLLTQNDREPIAGDTFDIVSVTGGGQTLDGFATITAPTSDHTGGFNYAVQDQYGMTSDTAHVGITVEDAALSGTSGNDIIIPGSANACLAGNGGCDTFVFQDNVSDGRYVITDFTAPSQGAGADTIDLTNTNGIADFQALLDAIHDCNGSAVIELGAGNTVTLSGVEKAALCAADSTSITLRSSKAVAACRAADHSALMPAALTTLPHFAVSAAISRAKSAAGPGSGAPPVSASRAFMAASEKAA
jgi:hypothetical protein